MNHSKLRYLYLHFGPGGNAELERKWLASYQSAVDFWDQPKDVSSFKELVERCASRYKSGHYDGLVAHSFGCDLALNTKELINTQDSKLILISPLRDIPKSFLNLAHKLAQETMAPDRKRQLNLAIKNVETANSKLEGFVQLVTAISADPLYYRRFWAQPNKLKEFEAIAPHISPLDINCWQTVLIDFILNYQGSLNGHKADVYMGSEDPYSGLIRDEELDWKQQGADFYPVGNAGHYPHLEANVFEKIFGTT